MEMDMNLRSQVRQFNSSAEARAAGFSTIQWLRAFSFAEHAARIERDHAAPKWYEGEE
jgi:hypothetical protein